MLSEMITLFDVFFDGLLFLLNNTILQYIVGLCVSASVFGLLKRLIS